MDKSDHKRGSISCWESSWLQKKEGFSLSRPKDDWDYFSLFRAIYLKKLIIKDKDALCLECGCGSASTSVYFANKGSRTVMLDASISALNLARRNFLAYNLRGNFVKGNLEELPFRDGKFDLVMSFGVLEHFEDMSCGIKEMARVLKSGGIFFASVTPKRFSVQFFGNLINTLMRFLYNIKHNRFKEAFLNSYPAAPEFYENSFCAQEYLKVVEGCGLKEVKLSGSRPFPSLDLPYNFLKGYIALMRLLKPLHLIFELCPSKFSEVFGAEWNIIGFKE